MNKFSIFSLIFFLFSLLLWCIQGSFLSADTHIPGGEVSGTWTIEGSPYIIEGEVTIPVDSTLVINPGVVIIFSINIGFEILGRLLSEAVENDSILFTVEDTTNSTSLCFCDTDVTNQDSSKIKYTRFEYIGLGFVNSSSVLMKKSVITKRIGYSGIYFDNSSPILADLLISNNTTEYYGGGLYCTDFSNPSLVNITISGNNATWGGGISCRFNSNPTLENISIMNNIAIGAGGGIFCEESNPILNFVDIIENHVSNGIGGGIHFDDNSNPEISNVNIENNSAYWGGGIGCTNSSPILTNVIISGNSGVEFGGGIYSEGTGNLILQDVIITGNSAQGLGGGIAFSGEEMVLINGIVADNYADDAGGIFCEEAYLNLTNVTISENNIGDEGIVGGVGCACECDVVIVNSILWDNENIELLLYGGCTSAVSYSDIQEGWQGIGNIDIDPMFSNDEFHLTEDSPCIDAGNPDSLYYDIEDPYNPGYALYPAMGTILNDMGTYGGHGYYEPPVSADEELITEKPVIKLNNYPNPFNPVTTIKFELPYNKKKVFLEIFNIKGQKIKAFPINQFTNQSINQIVWDGKDQYQNQVSSGIYLYRIRTDDFISKTKKMILIR